MRVPLIFLDTETTGLQPDRHTPWEVAWQTAVHDVEQHTLELVAAADWRVDLTDNENDHADPVALRVGRFEERYTDPEPAELVMRELRRTCQAVATIEHPVPHLVGAVPSFDHAMLSRWFGWPGFGEGLWHYHLIDVEALVAGKLGVAAPWKSDDLSTAIGVEVIDEKFRHTAAGDVQWAVALYAAVYELTIVDRVIG